MIWTLNTRIRGRGDAEYSKQTLLRGIRLIDRTRWYFVLFFRSENSGVVAVVAIDIAILRFETFHKIYLLNQRTGGNILCIDQRRR